MLTKGVAMDFLDKFERNIWEHSAKSNRTTILASRYLEQLPSKIHVALDTSDMVAA